MAPNNNNRMRALEGLTVEILASWRERINAAAVMAALPPGMVNRLQSGLADAITALQNLLDAKDQMLEKRLAADTGGMYSPSYYAEQIAQISAGVTQEAWNALDALRSAAADVQERLTSSLRPKKPAGVDSVLVVDRKQDLTAALTATGAPDDAPSIVSRAARMLQEALADGGNDSAALTAYCLAGGLMDAWYRAQGITPALQAAAFAGAMGKVQSRDGSPLPGAALVETLTGNGTETLQTFVVNAQQEIQRQTDSLKRFAGELQVTLSGKGGTGATGAAAVQPLSPSLQRYLDQTTAPGVSGEPW